MNETRECEVCGRKTEVCVVSSSLVPYTFAYCAECLQEGLEPYPAIISVLMGARTWDDIEQSSEQWFIRLIDLTLYKTSRTHDDLIRDCHASYEDMMNAMEY